MDLYDLNKKLSELGLEIVKYDNNDVSIHSPYFANPLLIFNLNQRGNSYDGNVILKSINRKLFTNNQVVKSIDLVDEFLREGMTT